MTATKATTPPMDDAVRCIDRMRPELQNVINRCSGGDALMAAMSISFAELLRDRGGDDEPLLRTMKVFTKFPSKVRKEARDAHDRLKILISDLKTEGFTLDVILWSMLGAITNILTSLRHSPQEVDAARADMIGHINRACSHRSIN
jgi:hypothetical protein